MRWQLRSLAVFLLIFLAVARAWADAEQPVVSLSIAGPDGRVERVQEAVGAALGRLPVQSRSTRAATIEPRSVIEPAPDAQAAFARIWIDLEATNRATLYFVDAAWERVLVRHLPLERDLDEVEREEIAQVVRAAVEALLAGAKIGISREEARQVLLPDEPVPKTKPFAPVVRERPAPAPRPAPAEPPLDVQAGGLYEAEWYSDRLWHGPGLFGSAGTRGDALRLAGHASLQYRAPIAVEGDALGARLQAFALRTLARGSYDRDGIGLCAAAGAGLDFTRFEPLRVAEGAVPAGAEWDVVPVGRLLAGFGLVRSGLGLWSVAGLDLDLIETRHVAERAGRKYTVFEAPRARPFVGLELGVGLSEGP